MVDINNNYEHEDYNNTDMINTFNDDIVRDDITDDVETLISSIEETDSIFVSIYQIYNETISDLLKIGNNNLKVRMDNCYK